MLPNPANSNHDARRQETHAIPMIDPPISMLDLTVVTADNENIEAELRIVIEQLRSRAREQLTQALELEKDKESLESQLENAFEQLHAAREREMALRARTSEAIAAAKQRDEAIESAQRHAKTIAELQKRIADISREQDAASSQREAVAKQTAAAARSAEAASSQLAQAQKKVLSIRLARDAAQSHSQELSQKLSAAMSKIADLEYAQEEFETTRAHAGGEMDQVRRERQTLSDERAGLIAQIAELSAEVDANRTRILDLAQQKNAANTLDNELTEALAQARMQVAGLERERDAARSRAQEQATELDELRTQLQALRLEVAAPRSGGADFEDLRRQHAALREERDEIAAREREISNESNAQQEQLATLADELAAVQRRCEDAVKRADDAQQQCVNVTRERDAGWDGQLEETQILEAQLSALRARDAELVLALEKAGQMAERESHELEKVRERARRCEDYRMESIELAGRLDAAQRDIIELTAHLAEARLQAKFALAASAKKTDEAALRGAPAAASVQEVTSPEIHELEHADESPALHESFTEKDARGALVAMRRCYQTFSKTPSDLSLLNELHAHAHGFSERARVSGLVALHRLSAAFASLAHHLYRVPETLNPSTLRTVQQTIEFLTALVRDRNLTHLHDPVKAQIYVVDDDADNCQAISMALEMVMLKVTSAQDPSVALGEIASGRYDLLLLDINLPGMDGFELCEEIRKCSTYATTPIVFLTGLNTLERRVQSTLSGGNDFIGKPFNLHELGVKTLTLILKTQLGIP